MFLLSVVRLVSPGNMQGCRRNVFCTSVSCCSCLDVYLCGTARPSIITPVSYPAPSSLLRQFTFPHGTFEKVNYLGYDDHVVLNRSISFLLEEEEDASEHPRQNGAGSVDGDVRAAQELGREAEDAGKLLTILTASFFFFVQVTSASFVDIQALLVRGAAPSGRFVRTSAVQRYQRSLQKRHQVA